MPHFDLPITKDLRLAMGLVLGEDSARSSMSIVALAALLDSCAKGYGLTESGGVDEDPTVRLEGWPEPDRYFSGLLAAAGRITTDGVRERIYEALADLSRDDAALRLVNKRDRPDSRAVLLLGQIHWNLEANDCRPKLPIKPAIGPDRNLLDIPAPGGHTDLAVTLWTARANMRWSGRTSGQGFRTAAARLTVLVAQWIVQNQLDEVLAPPGMTLQTDETGNISALRWIDERPEPTTSADVVEPARMEPVALRAPRPILLGSPAVVSTAYQPRWQDFAIHEAWASGTNGRVWLAGAPGTGKSYTARRIVQETLAQGESAPTLVVWIDRATPDAVREALAGAYRKLEDAGLVSPGGTGGSGGDLATGLLNLLRTSDWSWLVVYDDADGEDLIANNLVPAHANGLGRFLATTNSRSGRLSHHGTVVNAGMFEPDEADEYLRQVLGSDTKSGDRVTLADELGRQPLALAIAGATISAHRLTVDEWLDDFRTSVSMDVVGDEPDLGGHPGLVASTWLAALDRAGQGETRRALQRAAVVVAVQATSGHPTWLWDAPEIDEWVGGGNPLPRRHRVPAVLRALADHQVLQMVGDTWTDGMVTIHQLAARAILDHVPNAEVGEATRVVAQAWLREISGSRLDNSQMHTNLRAAHGRAGAEDDTRGLLAGLIHHSRPRALEFALLDVELTQAAEATLRSAGSLGTVTWAREWTQDAATLESASAYWAVPVDHLPTPTAMRLRALEALEGVCDDPNVVPAVRLRALVSAENVSRALGRAERAALFSAKASLLAGSVLSDPEGLEVDWVVGFMQLLPEAEHPPAAVDLLRREWAGEQDVEASSLAVTWTRMRARMLQMQRAGAAKGALEVAHRMLESYVSAPPADRRDRYLAGVVEIFVEAGDLDAAIMAADIGAQDIRSDRGHLLLASVRQRRRESEQAIEGLRRAQGASWGSMPREERGGPLEVPLVGEDWDFSRRVGAEARSLEIQCLAVTAMRLRLFDEAARLTEVLLACHEEAETVDLWAHALESTKLNMHIGIFWNIAGDFERSLRPLERAIDGIEFLAESGHRDHEKELHTRRTLVVTLWHLGRFDSAVEVLSTLDSSSPVNIGEFDGTELIQLTYLKILWLALDENRLEHVSALVLPILQLQDSGPRDVTIQVLRALLLLKSEGRAEEARECAYLWVTSAEKHLRRGESGIAVWVCLVAKFARMVVSSDDSGFAAEASVRLVDEVCSIAERWVVDTEALAQTSIPEWTDPAFWNKLAEGCEGEAPERTVARLRAIASQL